MTTKQDRPNWLRASRLVADNGAFLDDETVEVWATALDEAEQRGYAQGVEDAAKACEADAIAYEDRAMLEMHTSRLAASLQQQSAMSLRVASETIRALAKGGPR